MFVGVGVWVGVFVGVIVTAAVGVVPVVMQSKIASKLNVLQTPVLLGVGVGHNVLKYEESKFGHKLVIGEGPNNKHVPPGIVDKHHLVSLLL